MKTPKVQSLYIQEIGQSCVPRSKSKFLVKEIVALLKNELDVTTFKSKLGSMFSRRAGHCFINKKSDKWPKYVTKDGNSGPGRYIIFSLPLASKIEVRLCSRAIPKSKPVLAIPEDLMASKQRTIESGEYFEGRDIALDDMVSHDRKRIKLN